MYSRHKVTEKGGRKNPIFFQCPALGSFFWDFPFLFFSYVPLICSSNCSGAMRISSRERVQPYKTDTLSVWRSDSMRYNSQSEWNAPLHRSKRDQEKNNTHRVFGGAAAPGRRRQTTHKHNGMSHKLLVTPTPRHLRTTNGLP